MKLVGSIELAEPPEQVFDQLLDPQLLARCIPGCRRMDEVSPGVYETEIEAGVGAVKGSFAGRVTLSDVERFRGYSIAVEGKSTVGYVRGAATVRLEANDGGTRVHYDGKAQVSGLIAAVGGRLLDAAAQKVARDFFERLAAEVAD